MVSLNKSRESESRPRVTVELAIAALALVVLSFANTFSFARFAMVVIFGAVIAVPFLSKYSYWGYTHLNLASALFICYNVLSVIIHGPTPISFYNGLLASAATTLFVAVVIWSPRLRNLNGFIWLVSRAGGGMIVLGLVIQLTSINFTWVAKTGFLFTFLFFILLDKSRTSGVKILFCVLWIVQAYLADDRAYILAGVIFMLTFVLWPFLGRMRALGRFVVFLFLAALIVIPSVYVALSRSSIRQMLDELALKYTDGRFFSGRDVIWGYMLEEYSSNSLLLGGGHEVVPPEFFGVGLSAHNTFISVLTRTGAIGLCLLLLMFYLVLRNYLQWHRDFHVRVSAAFTIAILFKNSSELSLLGNNIALSIVYWLVIAFGFLFINAARREHGESNLNHYLMSGERAVK